MPLPFAMIKEGPTLKSSSSKLGTCQDWNCLTLAQQTLFQNQHLRMCVASPSRDSTNYSHIIQFSECMVDRFNSWTFSLFFFLFGERRSTGQRQSTWGSWPLGKFLSTREEISQLGIEPPTSSLRVGYLSTIIQQFRVILNQTCELDMWQIWHIWHKGRHLNTCRILTWHINSLWYLGQVKVRIFL